MADPISKTLSQVVPRPDYNVREGWIVVPKFPASDPRHRKTSPAGGTGVYHVTFVLAVPGKNVFREHVEMGKTHLDGDSLLLFPDKVETFEVRFDAGGSTIGDITLGHNSNRRLSTATMRIHANSLIEAEKAAYDMAAGFLSYLSYSSDVAIEITGYEVVEESTGTRKAVFGMLGKIKKFAIGDNQGSLVSDDKYRRLFAAYREGMNATNVFYQALSFSKAIEGCNKLRDHKNTQAKNSGEQPFRPSLQMPSELSQIPVQDNLIRDFFTPFLGRKFSFIVDHFRPLVRNAIAHLDPTQEVLDIDRFEDLHACERAVPILRYIARTLIRFEVDHP
jgi:hypothetical protein